MTTLVRRCEIHGHQWQTSISASEVEAHVRSVDDQIPTLRLREIARDMATQANRMLAARADRRICGICGTHGRSVGRRVVLPSSDAPTEAQ